MNEDKRKKLLRRKSKGFVQKLNKIGLTETKINRETDKKKMKCTERDWNAQIREEKEGVRGR